MRIDINFLINEAAIIKGILINGTLMTEVKLIGLETKEIYESLNYEDAIDIDELAEVIGKDRLIEWVENNRYLTFQEMQKEIS